MAKKVAVFDIDGTVFRSSLMIELVEHLVERGVFPAEARRIYEREKRDWHAREGDFDAYSTKILETRTAYLKGLPYGTVADVANEVVDEQKHRIYRYTRDLIQDLKKQNYFILAVSHSPKFMVDGFCHERGFDRVYGTFYEIGPSGNFTGSIEDQDIIENKGAVLTRILRKEELTLEGSVAVGDTDSDIPMLEMVEQPIAFNPSAKLYEHAKRRGWRIVVERKDVIYEL